jgi:DNA-binding LacI/PurR family transcriptional regulator
MEPMSTTARQNANVYDTARRLEDDLRQKGLAAGARYLTAAEAGRMLGVSTATAHRAMAILARQEMLIRRRNSGTFVGPQFRPSSKRRIRTLYAILPDTARDRQNYPFDLLVYGIGPHLPEVNLHVAFLPAIDSLAYLEDLIESAHAAGETAGFLAISCPREVYRRLADTGLPAVIHGSAYLDQADIPSVDVDNRQAGRRLTDYLVQRGHRRMALLCVTDHLPGDNLFFDGTSEALTAARLPHNALIMRSFPSDQETLAAEIRRLLETDDPPTALIARTPALGLAARCAVEKLAGASSGIDVVCYAHQPMPESVFPWTHVVPRVPFMDIVGRIAEMLDQQGRGEELETKHVLIPVDLRIAGAGTPARVNRRSPRQRRSR